MKKDEGTLGKWDLAHFQELISIYLSAEYPLSEYTLLKNGSLVKYEIWPRWFARAMDKVKIVEFPKIARDIYMKMTNGQSDDIGFASMYFKGIELEIIDVLFMLHTYARMSLKEKYQRTHSTPPSKKNMEIDMNNCLFQLTDGEYKISGFPLYMLHPDGQPIDLATIVARIKEGFRY